MTTTRRHPAGSIGAHAALVFALVAALPATARAQDATEYFRQGVQALREDHPERAVTMFEKSYALSPRAATLCNLALSYDRWAGHGEQAAATYDRCAEEDRTGRFRAHARGRAAEIREALAAGTGATEAGASTQPGPSPQPLSPSERGASEPSPRPGPSPQPLSPSGRGALMRRRVVWVPVARPRAERSHTLLWVGVGSGVLAGAAIVAGGVTVAGVQTDADYLAREYDGGDEPIAAGSEDAEILASARGRRDFGIALYAVGGALAALSLGLIIADVAQGEPDAAPGTTAAVVPVPGGALASVRVCVP